MAANGHLGLAGIQERAEQLGGALAVESPTDVGATVVLNVPVEAPIRSDS